MKEIECDRNKTQQGDDFSNKITVISFIMAVCIVYQHTKYHRVDNPYINDIRDFAFFLWTTCVPMFFAISGYLFFRNFRLNDSKKKLLRRIKTLLIPYLIWNLLYVCFMIVMHKLGLMSDLNIDVDALGITKAVINAECSPLWFIKYLLLFSCIAPIAYFVLRYRIAGGLLLMSMIAFNIFNYYNGAFDNGINVNANSLVMFNYQFVYFATGAYAALCWNKIVEKKNPLLSIVSVFGITVLLIVYWTYLKTDGCAFSNHIFRWLWIPLFWFSFDLLPQINIKPWMRYSFFIYCAHMFLIYCIQGISTGIYSSLGYLKPYFTIAEYCTLGIIVVFVLIQVIKTLKRHTPRLFNIITGNRG